MSMKQTIPRSKAIAWLLTAFLVVSLIAAGCNRPAKVRNEKMFEKWQVKAKESTGFSPEARRRSVAIGIGDKTEGGKPVVPAAPPRPLPDDLISISMTDIDVAVLLRALAKAANQNIIINEKVQGRANISIEKAPWSQVFSGVLNTHGLTYRREGDIIRIMTIDDLEAALRREEQKKDLRSISPLLTRIVRIDYADAAAMQGNLASFLSKDKAGQPIGSVLVDTHTNSLILRALEEDIELMLPLAAELDKPTPQVLIEAHIVEARKETAIELGVQWGGQYTTSDANRSYTVGAGSAIEGSNQIDIPSGNFGINFPANIGQGAGMTIGFLVQALDGSNQLAAQLSALQQENKLNILSTPSITTVDNQKAVFETGEEVPYQSVDGNGTPKTEFKDAVLRLDVTPHVIDGEALKLKIVTNKDEVDRSRPGVPSILTKRAETTVILYDGQTTVIGGLTESQSSDFESGVPGLKDVPVLGMFFKGYEDQENMQDVLIFITPHILKQHVGGPGGASKNQ